MNKQRLISILLFLLLQTVTIVGLQLFKAQEENNLIHERQEDLEQQYRASTLAYRRLADLAFEQHFGQPEVSALVARAKAAKPEERNRLRMVLYNRLLPAYKNLQKMGFRQIHFHFNDGTSFLRMHLPTLFGDQLRTIRPSVARIMESGKPLQGYEVGRHRHAYRFIFPLLTDNQYSGSVEISMPFSTLLANLMDTFPSQVRFVVRRQVAAQYLDNDALQRHYQTSSLSREFLEERPDKQTTPLSSSSTDRKSLSNETIMATINPRLSTQSTHMSELSQPLSLPLLLNRTTVLTTLLPVADIAGQWAGILIFYERFHYLDILRQRYILGWFTVTVFSLLLLLLHDRSSLKIKKSHAELNQIFNGAADGIRVIDLNGTIIRANATFAELVGLPMEEIIGRPCRAILPGESCKNKKCPRKRINKAEQTILEEAEKILPDGKRITCLMMAKSYTDHKGNLIGIIENFRDISDRKQLELRLQTLSVTDELTGLNNRRGFMTLAAQQLQNIKRSDNEAFLLFADLDNMKNINDTQGHDAGDRVLQVTARILRATVRESDIVARMGGDEFAVLLGTNPLESSEKVILKRLNMELVKANKGQPQEEQIAISFGLVRATAETTLEELLILADKKMYATKQQRKSTTRGKNGIV